MNTLSLATKDVILSWRKFIKKDHGGTPRDASVIIKLTQVENVLLIVVHEGHGFGAHCCVVSEGLLQFVE